MLLSVPPKDAIDAMDLVEMLDAAADIIFVLAGIIEKAGLGEYMEETMHEVLKSNDSKISPDGEVVRDALLWNDTRSAAAAEDLVAEFGDGDRAAGARWWADAVGSVPVASYTVTKLRWAEGSTSTTQ